MSVRGYSRASVGPFCADVKVSGGVGGRSQINYFFELHSQRDYHPSFQQIAFVDTGTPNSENGCRSAGYYPCLIPDASALSTAADVLQSWVEDQ
jgi:hypothetical protein